MVSTLQSPIRQIFTFILVEYRRACGHEDVSTPSFGSRLNLILGEQIIGLVSKPSFESHRRSWHSIKSKLSLRTVSLMLWMMSWRKILNKESAEFLQLKDPALCFPRQNQEAFPVTLLCRRRACDDSLAGLPLGHY